MVIAGGLSGAGDMLLAPLTKKLATDIPVKISRLGADAGIIGAALLGKELI